MLTQQRHSCIQLGLGNGIGTGQNDGRSGFNLVVVELTEVFHIYLDLAGIGNRHGIAQLHIVTGNLFNSLLHIGKLAHTGGLDDYPIGMIFFDDFLQGLAEIAHQAAANTAGVHLGNVDAGLLQETAVNADFAELILNQHQLLILIGLLNHLLNQRGLASAQEAGINVNFRHLLAPSIQVFSHYTTIPAQ